MSFRDRNSKRSGGSHRRHGGNRRGSGFKQAFENDEDNERASSSNRRPGRPPPGLRGKEIGLFYRDLQRANREKPFPIKISTEVLNEINHKLSKIEIPDLKPKIKPENETDTYDHIEDSHFKRKFLNTISNSFEDKLNEISKSASHIQRNPELDLQLQQQLEHLEKLPSDSPYKKLLKIRHNLPAFKSRLEILECIEANQVVVISGETGCGKTTQVPQFILDHYITEGRGSLCKIICTQPRRISAIAVAERVAEEKNSTVGKSGYSGYTIRLESNLPRAQGSILFCTTGILLQKMEQNLALDGISHLILDEIHERDIQTDITLAIIKQLITKRTDLKIILMSATLNAERFSNYFNNCPCLHIPGFTYPVEEIFLEDILQLTGYQFQLNAASQERRFHHRHNKKEDPSFNDYIRPYVRELQNQGKINNNIALMLSNPDSEKLDIDFIYEVTLYISNYEPEGAILIFLPGIAQISALNKKILEDLRNFKEKVNVIPLHSKLASIEQKSIFKPAPKGTRKIIIATNIAETSITIDDVVYVINPGQIKMKRYDPVYDIVSLLPEWVTQANSSQRRGRAGRVKPGKCYHLFTKVRHDILDKSPEPEILRSRLDEVILQLKILQINHAKQFLQTTLDKPNELCVNQSLKLLSRLNALDDNERLTPLGFHLARLPMDPRSGKMILFGALFSCLDPVLSIAASLSFKDAFNIPLGKENQVLRVKQRFSQGSKSDHLVLANAFKAWEQQGYRHSFCYENYLNGTTLNLLSNMKKQFAEYLHELNFIPVADPSDERFNLNSNNTSLIKAIVCAGLFPNIAKIKGGIKKVIKHPSAVSIFTDEDGTVCLAQTSVNSIETYFDSPFLVYFTKIKSKRIFLHDSTMVHALPIIFFADNIKYEEQPNSSNPDMILKLNDKIQFQCKEQVASLIKNVSKQLNLLLEYKVAHPGFIDWSQKDNYQVDILKVILQMATLEDTGSLEYYD